MRSVSRSAVSALLCFVAIAFMGCAKPKPAEQPPAETTPIVPVEFKVVAIELGSRIGPDKKVTSPASTFAAKDTIYVSVSTDGPSPGVKLAARWTFGPDGQLVNDMSETIAPTGPATTEFHLNNPSGWPAGKYRVEVTADGNAAGTKEFDVK